MSKMTNWIAIMSGVMLLAYISGVLPSDSATGFILSIVLNPENIKNMSVLTAVFGFSGLVGVIALAGSFVFNRQYSVDLYIVLPMVTILLAIGYDFVRIYSMISSYGALPQVIGLLIFGPLMLMFIINVMEWWRGINP